MNLQTVEHIVDKHGDQQGALIAILEEIQSAYSYLPAEAMKAVAQRTGQSLVDIYGVATFYKAFSLKPRGQHVCSVCVGTACHVRGAEAVAGEFERQMGVKAGETTADRQFTLEKVACLGACALGPIVVMDGHYFADVKASGARRIIAKTRSGLDKVEVKTDKRVFPVDVSCPRCNHSLMNPNHLIDGHPCIHVTVAFERQHGWCRLSSLYGSYTIEEEHESPKDTIVDFFCPHCHAQLIGASRCAECGSAMVPMIVRRGGMVQTCSRKGCHGHLLDLDGVNF